MSKLPADQIQYWVRNEQGRTWGPYAIPVLARMRGQLTGRCEVSLDGKKFRPSSEFPELKDLLSATREVMAPIDQPKAGPRISAAMAAAFGIQDGVLKPLQKSDAAEPAAKDKAGAPASTPAAPVAPKSAKPVAAPKAAPVAAPKAAATGSAPPAPAPAIITPVAAPRVAPAAAPLKSVPPAPAPPVITSVAVPKMAPAADVPKGVSPAAAPRSVPPAAPAKSVPPVVAPQGSAEGPAAPRAAAPASPGAAAAAGTGEAVPATSAAAPAPAPSEEPRELPEKGDLAELSPVHLYGLAALTSASGWLQLELESGRMLTLSFRRGVPEHLASDDPELSLLRFLQKNGTVTPAQGIAAEEHARRAGTDVVSALFALQLVPPSDAARLLGEHAHFLLDRALVCWRGTFSFEKDAPPPPGSFPLGQRWTLLAESIRRLDPAPLRARLGRRLQWPILKSGGLGIGRIEELALNAQEARLYASIDGTRTGEELLAAQDSAQTLRLLFLLTELSHLSFAVGDEPAEPSRSQVSGSTAPAKPQAGQSQAGQSQTGQAQTGQSPGPGPATIPPVPGPAAAGAPASTPPPIARTRPAAPSAPPKAAPPVLAPAAKPVSTTTIASGPKDETFEAQFARLAALQEKLSAANHFEALGLARTASAAEVKRTFFLLARELHPDTVVDPAQEKLRALKETLFSRVNEAAQVLGDEKRRREYAEELDGNASKVDVARIFAAEEAFQKAEILIKARKYQDGLELLEEAIALNDEEAEFHAWHGYAKFLLAKDRKGAYADCVADCKRALKLVEVCVPAHLFMGHMAKAIGDLKAAEAAYHRVLQHDEKNIEAQRELRMMGKK